MIPAWWNDIKYFKPEEFDSPDEPGSGEGMDTDFIRLLDDIRKWLGYPLKITSGYRSLAHNAKVGGKPSSAHMSGFAADIATPDIIVRHQLIKAALQYEVRRIGIGKTFVHLDVHPTLPQDVIWLY